MMHLDFSSTLNLISTIAIIGALVFTALQVRQGNLKRSEQAAVTVIQTTQSVRSIYSANYLKTRKFPTSSEWGRE
jgi:hypothetical protein